MGVVCDYYPKEECYMQDMTVTVTDDSKAVATLRVASGVWCSQTPPLSYYNAPANKKKGAFFSKTIKRNGFTMYTRDALHD
jgi:hypothetical protein